jgi:hypothetical protein
MWMRATVAFTVAPAIGALGASLFAAAIWSIYVGFFVSALMVAYGVALLVGVPAFLFSRSWLPLSIWAYALAGALVATVSAVPMVFFFPISLAVLSILTGAIAGVTFGLIVMPTSNNRWRGP